MVHAYADVLCIRIQMQIPRIIETPPLPPNPKKKKEKKERKKMKKGDSNFSICLINKLLK